MKKLVALVLLTSVCACNFVQADDVSDIQQSVKKSRKSLNELKNLEKEYNGKSEGQKTTVVEDRYVSDATQKWNQLRSELTLLHKKLLSYSEKEDAIDKDSVAKKASEDLQAYVKKIEEYMKKREVTDGIKHALTIEDTTFRDIGYLFEGIKQVADSIVTTSPSPTTEKPSDAVSSGSTSVYLLHAVTLFLSLFGTCIAVYVLWRRIERV